MNTDETGCSVVLQLRAEDGQVVEEFVNPQITKELASLVFKTAKYLMEAYK